MALDRSPWQWGFVLTVMCGLLRGVCWTRLGGVSGSHIATTRLTQHISSMAPGKSKTQQRLNAIMGPCGLGHTRTSSSATRAVRLRLSHPGWEVDCYTYCSHQNAKDSVGATMMTANAATCQVRKA